MSNEETGFKPSTTFPTEDSVSAQRLGHRDAGTAACTGCESGCCIFVPIQTIQITKYMELDYARYLLGFERIELTMYATGDWGVYYVEPCRNLDLESRKCKVHGTSEQPTTCKRFNPYNCSYKVTFHSPDSIHKVRFDLARLEHYASLCEFDGHRRLIKAPDFETLLKELPPMTSVEERPPVPANGIEAWKQAVVSQEKPAPRQDKRFSDFADPCVGCAAWCCTSLFIPIGTPGNVSTLDHVRFFLGFSGLEIGLTDQGWSLVVRSRCRHLVREANGAGRCGVFGQPQRPQTCVMYDASSCAYRERLGVVRPKNYLRIRYEEMSILLDACRFDDNGMVTYLPSQSDLRQAIEQSWLMGQTP